MKAYLFSLLAITLSLVLNAQETKTISGVAIKNYGQFYPLEGIDLNLDNDASYKVIFDVYTDNKSIKKMNLGINTVARFINMHQHDQTDIKNFDIVVVLHGAATKNALNDVSFTKKYKTPNPNKDLINALTKYGVKVYVCGQSLAHNGFKKENLNPHVKMSLSALTALVYYQNLNYQLITFN